MVDTGFEAAFGKGANPTVLQLQQVEALRTGGVNLRETLRVRKVLARELSHLAYHAALQDLPRDLPHIDILLVNMGEIPFLIGHQDPIRGRLQCRPHDHERLSKLSGALFQDFVRPTNFLLGTLPDLKNGRRRLQGSGPELFCFVLGFRAICH